MIAETSPPEEEEHMVVGDLVEFMERLSLAADEERPGMLNEISPIISSVAARNANFKKNLAEANLNLIFDCFNSKGQDELDIASDVLLKISEYIEGDLLVKKYAGCFKKGLEHPNPSVREAHMKLLRKSMRSAKGFEEVMANHVLVTLATRCAKDSNLSVAKESMAFLESLSSLDQASAAEMTLLRDPVLPLIKELTHDKSEIVRLRIYEVLVRVAKKSDNHLGRVAKHQFLQNLFDELKKNDILLQLNALEVLTDLAQVRQGLDYLENAHILRDLEQSIDSFSSSATANFLIPGVVKFFGVVANQHRLDCLELYPKFKHLLTSMLMGNDVPDRVVAIETLAHICRNPRKKILFSDKDSYGELVQLFASQLNSLIKSGGTEGRSKGLGVLADLCQLHKEEAVMEEEELIINQRLMEMFDDKPLALLTQYAKLPILEVSGMAYQLLLALSDQEWALRKFQNHPGFMEFLLDRNTVMDKQILETKFDIIGQVTENVSAEQIFPEEMMKRMKQYVKEGPFYSPASVQVAFDEM